MVRNHLEISLTSVYIRGQWLQIKVLKDRRAIDVVHIRDAGDDKLAAVVDKFQQCASVTVIIHFPIGRVADVKDEILVLISKISDVVCILEKLQVEFLKVIVAPKPANKECSGPEYQMPIWLESHWLGGTETLVYQSILFPLFTLKDRFKTVSIRTPVADPSASGIPTDDATKIVDVKQFVDYLENTMAISSHKAPAQPDGLSSDIAAIIWWAQYIRLTIDQCPGAHADMLRAHRFSYEGSSHHMALKEEHNDLRCESGPCSPLRCLCPIQPGPADGTDDGSVDEEDRMAHFVRLHPIYGEHGSGMEESPTQDDWFIRYPGGLPPLETAPHRRLANTMQLAETPDFNDRWFMTFGGQLWREFFQRIREKKFLAQKKAEKEVRSAVEQAIREDCPGNNHLRIFLGANADVDMDGTPGGGAGAE